MSSYYKVNKDEFINSTINCDMSFHYNMFEKYLNIGDSVLEVGFGSGRDYVYFSKKYNPPTAIISTVSMTIRAASGKKNEQRIPSPNERLLHRG